MHLPLARSMHLLVHKLTLIMSRISSLAATSSAVGPEATDTVRDCSPQLLDLKKSPKRGEGEPA